MDNIIALNKYIKIKKIDAFLFYACVIDMLFLPYFWMITMPYSLPIVVYWLIIRYDRIKWLGDYILCYWATIVMITSVVFSVFVYPENIFENITITIRIISIYVYYIMFNYYVKEYDVNIKNILMIFILFVGAFVVLYNVDRMLYQNVRFLWNAKLEQMIFVTSAEGYRFGFIWIDANNIAYAITTVAIYMLCNEKTSFFWKLITFVVQGLVLIGCMSNGGLLAAFISYVLLFSLYLRRIIFGKLRYSFRRRIKISRIFSFFFIVLLLAYIVPNINNYLTSPVYREAINRVNTNSGESRILIWQRIFEEENLFKYVAWGQGGVTMRGGQQTKPHNGHLFWILSYGMIAYFIFMYVFFRKRKVTPMIKYVYTIPSLIGFTINIMIGEAKFSALFALLVVCASSKKYLDNVEEKRS